MPLLLVAADPVAAPDAVLIAAARAVADALALPPDAVLVARTARLVVDADGRPAAWASVLVQGRDRGSDADAAVAAAIRSAWPDDRLSVAVVRDLV